MGKVQTEAIREKPIWRLTECEIDALPAKERQWVINHLHDMRADGTLAMLLANPPGTIYEVNWNQRGWHLHPSGLQAAKKALQAVVAAEVAASDPNSKIDYSTEITRATAMCAEALKVLSPEPSP